MSFIALCDTISKSNQSFKVLLFVKIGFHGAIYHASKFCLVLAFFGGFEITIVHVKQWNSKTDRIYLVSHVITTLKLSLVNLWNFFKKNFDLISFSSQ